MAQVKGNESYGFYDDTSFGSLSQHSSPRTKRNKQRFFDESVHVSVFSNSVI